jgi:hypothetical protein
LNTFGFTFDSQRNSDCFHWDRPVLTCPLADWKITSGYYYGVLGGAGVGTTMPGAIGISSTPVTRVT